MIASQGQEARPRQSKDVFVPGVPTITGKATAAFVAKKDPFLILTYFARFMGFLKMSEPKSMLVVQREGERFTYKVESSSHHGMAHVVTLSANGGLGACTCEHYRFTIAKNQKLKKYIEWRPGRKGASECRHIWGARRQFIRDNLNPFMASFDNGIPVEIVSEFRKFLSWKGDKINLFDWLMGVFKRKFMKNTPS